MNAYKEPERTTAVLAAFSKRAHGECSWEANLWNERTALVGLGVVVVNCLQMNKPAARVKHQVKRYAVQSFQRDRPLGKAERQALLTRAPGVTTRPSNHGSPDIHVL